MRVSAIVAYDKGRVIGCEGSMPWRIPSDLARFKSLTMGKPIIMGRRTFESIGRPLPGRTNIVLTRRGEPDPAEGIVIARSLEEALRKAEATGAEEAMVIGGEEVFREALPLCRRVHASEIDARLEGDVWFPEMDPSEWAVVEEKHVPAGERDQYAHTYKIYERRAGSEKRS